ncbi:MAG: MFS transporter [Alphaproteobacteria bacterium]
MTRDRLPATARAPARGSPVLYGWKIVTACLVIAVLAWGLGLFGASVYLCEINQTRGWSIGLISPAVTGFFLSGAVSSTVVGPAMAKYGPRRVIACCAFALAAGVAGIGKYARHGMPTPRSASSDLAGPASRPRR